jgi:hypothetical protein
MIETMSIDRTLRPDISRVNAAREVEQNPGHAAVTAAGSLWPCRAAIAAYSALLTSFV